MKELGDDVDMFAQSICPEADLESLDLEKIFGYICKYLILDYMVGGGGRQGALKTTSLSLGIRAESSQSSDTSYILSRTTCKFTQLFYSSLIQFSTVLTPQRSGICNTSLSCAEVHSQI